MVARLGGAELQPLGTSFALGGRRVATALHVVNDSENLQIILPRDDIDGYQDTVDRSARAVAVKVVEADPIRDLAVLELPEDAHTKVAYKLTGTDGVEPGSEVVIFGFPHADTGRFVLTRQDAHVGARILLENRGVKSKHLVLNTLLRPGQSGGPVFDSVGNVVAILVGSYAPQGGGGIRLGNIDPFTLHQTTHAVSAEYLAAMVR